MGVDDGLVVVTGAAIGPGGALTWGFLDGRGVDCASSGCARVWWACGASGFVAYDPVGGCLLKEPVGEDR